MRGGGDAFGETGDLNSGQANGRSRRMYFQFLIMALGDVHVV
jgi:hypothetical protein